MTHINHAELRKVVLEIDDAAADLTGALYALKPIRSTPLNGDVVFLKGNVLKQFGTHPTIWPMIAKRVYQHDHTCACCDKALPMSVGDPGRSRETIEGQPMGQLHIYHLNGDRSDLRRWNLVQLCTQCADGMFIMEFHKPLVCAPRPWLYPYIAGCIESNRDQITSVPAGPLGTGSR